MVRGLARFQAACSAGAVLCSLALHGGCVPSVASEDPKPLAATDPVVPAPPVVPTPPAPPAPPGSLDGTFGGGTGSVNIPSPAAGSGAYDVGYGVTVDSAGRILIVGESYGADTLYHSFICRLDTSGNLDGTFGSGGCSETASTAGGGFNDVAYAVTVDGSDRPVVTGVSRDSGYTQEWMTVWRYTTGGALDASFGSGSGFYTSTNAAAGGINRDGASTIALGGSGDIFLAGGSRGGAGIEMAVWAIDAAGTGPLPGFPQTDLPTGAGQHGGGGVIQHSNGNIVVAGYSTPAINGSQALWNYASDGTLQGTGPATDTGGWPSAGAGPLVEDSGSTVIVAGNMTDTAPTPAINYLALWRYTLGAPSTLTPGFGSGAGSAYYAIALPGYDYDSPAAIARDSLGRIVVAGFSHRTVDNVAPAPDNEAFMVVWRFTSTGNYDTTFGGGLGYVTFPSAIGATLYPYDQASALRIDSAGRYVIAGRSRDDSGNLHLVVWRINP